MTEKYQDNTALKLSVMQGISGVMAMIVTAAVMVNLFIYKDYLFAGIELLYVVLCLRTSYCLREGLPVNTLIKANMAGLVLIVLYGITTTQLKSGLIFTAFVLPAVFHVFLSLPLAALASGLLGLCAALLIMYKSNWQASFVLFNFLAVYLSIWAVSRVYEKARIEIYEQLKFNALHDALTGALNRQALIQDFALLARRQDGYALMLDIDYFKRINDSYGHLAGDEVIRHLVSTAQQLHDKGLVYRIGGEEFLLLLPDSSSAQGMALAERLRANVEQAVCQYAGQDLPYTVSIGVAAWAVGEKLEQLLHDADDALYAAKRGGRNRVVVHADLPASLP